MAEQQQQQCISTLASALEQQEPAGHTQLERLLQYGLANCFSPQATPQASGDGQEASAGMFGGCILVAAFACALGQLLALPFLPPTTALPPAPAGGLAQGDGACVCVCVLLACVRACMYAWVIVISFANGWPANVLLWGGGHCSSSPQARLGGVAW